MAGARRQFFGQQAGGVGIVEVARAAAYAVLEVAGIGSVLEHLRVVVGLDHHVVGVAQLLAHRIGHLAHVGHEAEADVLHLDAVAAVGHAVVGHGEGGDGEGAEDEGLAVGDDVTQFAGHLLVHEAVAVHADVSAGLRIDGQVERLGKGADRLHMVGMVVGSKDGFYLRHGQAVVAHVFAELAQAYPQIDEQSVAVGIEIVAVSAATASKADKVYHSSFLYRVCCGLR